MAICLNGPFSAAPRRNPTRHRPGLTESAFGRKTLGKILLRRCRQGLKQLRLRVLLRPFAGYSPLTMSRQGGRFALPWAFLVCALRCNKNAADHTLQESTIPAITLSRFAKGDSRPVAATIERVIALIFF